MFTDSFRVLKVLVTSLLEKIHSFSFAHSHRKKSHALGAPLRDTRLPTNEARSDAKRENEKEREREKKERADARTIGEEEEEEEERI